MTNANVVMYVKKCVTVQIVNKFYKHKRNVIVNQVFCASSMKSNFCNHIVLVSCWKISVMHVVLCHYHCEYILVDPLSTGESTQNLCGMMERSAFVSLLHICLYTPQN